MVMMEHAEKRALKNDILKCLQTYKPSDLLTCGLLLALVLAPEPPAGEDAAELHVEDDGVASEEPDLLLQHGSLLRPRHVVGLQAVKLQSPALCLQTQSIVLRLHQGKGEDI